jgi:hypothetical protein
MASSAWGAFFMTNLCAVMNYISEFMCIFLDVSSPVLEFFKF